MRALTEKTNKERSIVPEDRTTEKRELRKSSIGSGTGVLLTNRSRIVRTTDKREISELRKRTKKEFFATLRQIEVVC